MTISNLLRSTVGIRANYPIINFAFGILSNMKKHGALKDVNNMNNMGAVPLWQMIGHNRNIIRLAGLLGTSAVVLGAIGSHRFDEKSEMKNIFETANRFHFFHSIALLGMPFSRFPLIGTAFMIIGMVLFCGLLYHRAWTGKKSRYSQLAPVGGFCLMAGWLSLVF